MIRNASRRDSVIELEDLEQEYMVQKDGYNGVVVIRTIYGLEPEALQPPEHGWVGWNRTVQ
jgi:hypothetical protein